MTSDTKDLIRIIAIVATGSFLGSLLALSVF
jgi:hypothetical protein